MAYPKKKEIYPKKESHSKLLSKVYTIKRSCGRKLMYVALYWGIIVRETMAWASGKVLVQHVVVILLIALVGGANATAICNMDLRPPPSLTKPPSS
jgi:hypothetical protein